MKVKAEKRKAVFVLAPALLLCACSSQRGPVQGSPEWLYAAARDSYTAGDLEKATDHLGKIEQQGNNPFVPRARPWRMVIEAGLANAQLEVGQAYTDGWAHSGAHKNEFFKQKTAHFKEARRHTLHLVESYDALVKGPVAPSILLDFAFPKGSGAPVTELDRVYKGMKLVEEQRDAADQKVANRGMVRAVSSVVTTPDDVAGAQKAMEAGKVEVSSSRFLAGMATALDKLSGVFDRKGLDESDKVKILRERALDAAKRAMELKPEAGVETALKKLQGDLEKALKAPPSRVQAASR